MPHEMYAAFADDIREGLGQFADARARIDEPLGQQGVGDAEGCRELAVPFAGVDVDQAAIGATAVELLLEALAQDGPARQVRFEPELVVRTSTAG